MALVTIIADASHCPVTKAGGYGVWIAGDYGKRSFGGPINGAADSSEIESKALCNALWHGISDGLIKRGDMVLLQSDCQAALLLLECKRAPRFDAEYDVLDWLTDTTMRNEILLKFRHVKGHTCKKDHRSKAQDHCDKLAYKYMSSERNRIKCVSVEKEVLHIPQAMTKEVDWKALKAQLHSISNKSKLLTKRS